MRTPKEINMLENICEEAKSRGKIAEKNFSLLSEAFGSRFVKAWEALEEGRVKKYVFGPSGRVVWIVVGREREYLIMPTAGFCSCDDFYFRVMDKEAHLCYHLIAQKIAEALEWHDKVEGDDSLYDVLMKEWNKVTP